MPVRSGSEASPSVTLMRTGMRCVTLTQLPLRVRLDDGQDLPSLRTGMSASVEVDTGHARGLPKVVTKTLAALGLGSRTAVAAPAQ